MKTIKLSLEKISSEPETSNNLSKSPQKLPSLADLEQHITNSERKYFWSEQIDRYLQQDPDNLLKNTCINNTLKANFQFIALAKLSGKTWQEISNSLEIDSLTLCDFFQSYCSCYAKLILQKLQFSSDRE
jgi:hypothetical protein